MCVTKPRTTSEDASRSTIRSRSHLLAGLRTQISGGSSQSVQIQFRSEIMSSSKEERQSLLKQAGLQTPNEINAEEGLAFKAQLSIPWQKLCHIRRYLLRTLTTQNYYTYM